MPEPPDRLAEVVAAVLGSAKYRDFDPGLVREVGARELAKGRDTRAAIKATKSKLHQVSGVYQGGREDYAGWLADLAAAYAADPGGRGEAVRAASARIMEHHASTRERLPILGPFYDAIFGALPPIGTVLDVACGLNPLALPWMPLAPGASYAACDIDQRLIGFLDGYLALPPVRGRAELRDVTRDPPPPPADLALILKAIPCLEQLDREAGRRLLDTIRARHLAISFPARSLGGRDKGMAATYRARFAALAAGRDWAVESFEFPSELVFVVTTPGE